LRKPRPRPMGKRTAAKKTGDGPDEKKKSVPRAGREPERGTHRPEKVIITGKERKKKGQRRKKKTPEGKKGNPPGPT